jgi:response regulator RpfG family c-di-GMP phosphodiesterase
LRILVVESDAEAAKGAADVLRLDGHRVQTTLDSSSALRAAQTQPPDVVLVGADSLRVDGCELAAEIQRLPLFRRPLVIAVVEPEQRLGCPVESGIHLQLLKPINKAFLSRVLRRFQSVVMPPDDPAECSDAALLCT